MHLPLEKSWNGTLALKVLALPGQKISGEKRAHIRAQLLAKTSAPRFSLSYCPSMAGVLLCRDDSLSVGLDIEEIDRVRKKTAQRICSDGREYSRTPGPAILWTAKEASYKAMPQNKGLFLRDILTFNWRTLEGGTHGFSFVCGNLRGRGKSFSHNNVAVSFAWFSPSGEVSL